MECALNGRLQRTSLKWLVRVRKGERTERWTRLCVSLQSMVWWVGALQETKWFRSGVYEVNDKCDFGLED